ncbi:BZ3500_MvSof-1268-A1-R1_Chr9g10554 [Microbotryum saponariae]|uniref:Alkaline phosphatase n=1 Tax=Microbotryum saponariae TaxID=289078 RepID=A0A2X0K962_9BASI|nr:BZ3501_MvSof-1269-A2-R1_Chr9g10303 [Microbotryum saponariae]SDA00289.1 BZ3500_MvSof-1268-A1-R1_Chr9g10554 [Microbotryum saponariae]
MTVDTSKDDIQFVLDELASFLAQENASVDSLPTEQLLHGSDDADHELGSTEASHYDEKLPEPVTSRGASGRSRIIVPTRADIAARVLNPRPGQGASRWLIVVAGLLSLLLIAWTTTALLTLGTRFGHSGPKMNVILMISDGMGPASASMARTYLQHLSNAIVTSSSSSAAPSNALNTSIWAALAAGFKTPRYGMTPLDEILVGSSRTRSSSSLVTDSAAGATAFACAIKTYNGAIGVEPSQQEPCGTVLEAAKRQGFATGLVTTSRITHATPASFYAHVVDRDLESEIASFLVGKGPQGQVVDIALGGGMCFMRPNSTGAASCRTDDQDMLAVAQQNGYTVLDGIKALRNWHDESNHDGSPVLGLFSHDHMEYEIDRQQIDVLADEQPSLKEMTTHALRYLANQDTKGFFLMIEGARIDMAAHNNDPVGHVSDMLAYLETVQFVKEWVKQANDDTPTLLISISDHETGGLALARQLGTAYPEYAWYPDALTNATHSSSYLGSLLAKTASPTRQFVRELLEQVGVSDATEDEVAAVYAVRTDAYRANRLLADAISRRAQVGWSTAGHSGVDVNLYAYGHNASGIAGNHENTHIGDHIAHVMGLNLEVVTLELRRNADRWHSTSLGQSPTRRTEVGHYHGDF